MQLCFPISNESSNVASQFSTVKSDSRLKVVVLLQQRNANGLNLAAEMFQQLRRGSNRSCDLSVHRSKARLDQPTNMQCLAGNWRIGRFSSLRVDGESIDTIWSLHNGKRRRNVTHAAS